MTRSFHAQGEDVGEKEETKEDDEDEMKRYGCMCNQRSGCLSFKNMWLKKKKIK